jgi:CHAD domain-containing protein
MKPHAAAVIPFKPRPPASPPRLPGPVKASPAPLDRAMSVGAAFRAVMGANLAHLRANDRGMLEGHDPEYLHQMRVALRRLRSGVSVFAPVVPGVPIGHVSAEMKWLSGRLGPARDWDVFVAETLPPVAEAFGPHPGLERFAARCESLRAAAAVRARRAVRSARYQRLLLRLEQWLAGEEWMTRLDIAGRAALAHPAVGFASGVLEARYDRVLRRGRSIGRSEPRELHRLRIAIKKFRYAADFFATLYEEKETRAALKRLSRLQDILGAMNDAATVAGLAAEGFKGMSGAAAREAKGFVLGWSRGRAATLRRQLKSAWKEFSAAEKFW